MIKQIRLFMLICFMFSFAYAANTANSDKAVIYIKTVRFKGDVNHNILKDLKKISKHYLNRRLDIKTIKKLKKDLTDYFKKKGLLFVKVVLPSQDLSKGSIKFFIVRAKIENIKVKGNKYYLTKFIEKVFGFKKGESLKYKKMLKSMVFLNDYEDLSVKSYLKKGSTFGTTDITLNVKDSKPFHASLTFDNLGSKDTSKNRVTADIDYGNLLFQGDEAALKSTLGLKSLNTAATKLILSNYMTTPLENYLTRINFGYIYADYVTTGDFSALDMQGDTNIYTIGIKQPLFYSTSVKSDLSVNYYRKNIKSYLLGKLSTKDNINIAEVKLDYKYSGLKDIFSFSAGVSRGIGANNSLQSRLNTDGQFIKYNFDSSYIRYINPKNYINISISSQYSLDRLPLSELFTIGGFSSVRGFKAAQKLGDGGVRANIEWFYRPKLDFFQILKNSIQIGFFVDYGKIFNNRSVPGEDTTYVLSSYGTEIVADIRKKYFGSIVAGFPMHASDKTVERDVQIYGYIGVKLW